MNKLNFILDSGNTSKLIAKALVLAMLTLASVRLTASEINGDIKVFPNPANQIVNIDFSAIKNVNEIRVFNAIGQTILEVNAKNLSGGTLKIQTDTWQKGIYYVQIQTPLDILSYKLQIQH